NQGIDKSKVVAAGKEVDRLQSFGEVERITSRVLLLAGAKDAGGVASAQRLHDRIDGSVLQVIDGAGHLVNKDAPAAFNQAVADFLG
ncbi:MAG TPA: alpha/beta hydrolase, partial [Candidatus Avipropionibacterium avicola]|nr:alpha/beta hydrolase [Candidatus Avipropionibacterium avicola]